MYHESSFRYDNRNRMNHILDSAQNGTTCIEMNNISPSVSPITSAASDPSVSVIIESSSPNVSTQENHIVHRVSRGLNQNSNNNGDNLVIGGSSIAENSNENKDNTPTPTFINVGDLKIESKEDLFAEEDRCCGKLPLPVLMLRRKIRKFLKYKPVRIFVYTIIIINSLMLCVKTFNFEGRILTVLDIIDKICEIAFLVEVILRLISQPLTYFLDILVILDIGSVFVSMLPEKGIYSLIRLIKVIRLFSHISLIKAFFKTVVKSFTSVVSIITCLFIVCYVYALIGWTLFREHYPDWFGDIWSAFFTLFQVMTLESWSSGIARVIMKDDRIYALYFVTFIMVTTYCLVSAFNSLITSAMVESQTNEKLKEVEMARKKQAKVLPIKLNLYNEQSHDTIIYSGYATIEMNAVEEYEKTHNNES